MEHSKYSEEFKRTAVQKLLNRGSRSANEISKEIGVSLSALYRWSTELAYQGEIKNTGQRPQDRNPEEMLRLLIEFEKTPEENRGEFLRKEGLHTQHLENWRNQLKMALNPGRKSEVDRNERIQNRLRIKELERDLRRKDRALAEATALLILKKKAELIWGIEVNE